MTGQYSRLNRKTLQQLAKLRRQDARALLQAGRFQASYYLMGYSVECAIKACIAKKVREHDFPDKELVQKVYTHNMVDLLHAAGIKPDFDEAGKQNPALLVNWAVVKDWSPNGRYEVGVTARQAEDLYSACTARKNGVLNWIKKLW